MPHSTLWVVSEQKSHLTKSDTSETFRVSEMGGPESVQTIFFQTYIA